MRRIGCLADDHQDGGQLQSSATKGPELTMRRRTPSSGLSARDQVACMTQASVKCRKSQHDGIKVGIRCEKSNTGSREGSGYVPRGLRSVSAPAIGGQDDMGRLGAVFGPQARYDIAVAQPSGRAGKGAQEDAGIPVRDEQ